MSDKMKYDDYIITSIEEQEYIKKDFRKAISIIGLTFISSLLITFILYFF